MVWGKWEHSGILSCQLRIEQVATGEEKVAPEWEKVKNGKREGDQNIFANFESLLRIQITLILLLELDCFKICFKNITSYVKIYH